MSGVLDEVYERLRATGPEFDGWLSNHGPMAADALLRLGPDDVVHVHRWVDRYLDRLEEAPSPHRPIPDDGWAEALGDAGRLGDWRAYFDRQLAAQPWTEVLGTWWPRLLPGAIAGATHGLIRTGHAVRALREERTAPRIGELAQALGYWAARWQTVPGAVAPAGSADVGRAFDDLPVVGSGGIVRRLGELGRHPAWSPALAALAPVGAEQVPAALDALVDAAVVRYGRWAPGSPVMLVHAATAPRAAALALPSLPSSLWPATYAAAWAASAAITAVYRSPHPLPDPPDDVPADALLDRVLRNGDEHVIKFAETATDAADRGVRTARGAAVRATELITG